MSQAAAGSTIVFSICVPSYNRGRKALELVKATLPGLEEGWELIVLDNCSTRECDEYEAIGRMAAESSGKLVYIRNESNVGFHGNYMNCFRFPRGEYAMFISDEDRANLTFIPKAVGMMRERSNVGVVRGGVAPVKDGGVRKNSFQLKDVTYAAGREALVSYALANNYFSGTIYNLSLLKRLGLVDRLEDGLLMHRDYPHLYIEGLASAITDVVLSSEISCFEGEPQTVAGSADPKGYSPPYSFGGRLDQFLVLRDCLREAVALVVVPYDSELFGNLYIKHVAKFMYLVGKANADLYARNSIDVGVAIRAFAYFACAAMLRLTESEPHRDQIMEEVDKLARQYGG